MKKYLVILLTVLMFSCSETPSDVGSECESAIVVISTDTSTTELALTKVKVFRNGDIQGVSNRNGKKIRLKRGEYTYITVFLCETP